MPSNRLFGNTQTSACAMGKFRNTASMRLIGETMNTLKSLTVAAVPLMSSGIVLAQTGTMMDGGNFVFGWMPVLLMAIVVALVILIIERKD
jgi:hypothetical protein